MKRSLIIFGFIALFALANSCREPVLEYPLTYIVKKTAGDSSKPVYINYYVRGDYLRDTLKDTCCWSAEWENAKSEEYLSLEAESFESAAHIQIIVENDGGPFLGDSVTTNEYLKNPKITHTLE